MSDSTHWLDESTIDVGIDIGKRRLAYGWPSYALSGYIDLGKPGLSRDVELRQLQVWLRRWLPEGVQLWVDQSFAGAGAVSTAQSLSETIAAVMTAQNWARPPIIVHQATWKSALLHNHMASKAEVDAWLLANHASLHAKCMTEDEVDAMTIGVYGRRRSEGLILAPEPRRKRSKR